MFKVDLSFIIPNFNSGKLLDQTLASIFSKESSYSFEVLIMDNLSTDNPGQYINKYPKESILYHSEQDIGIYDAMNKGIQIAKGNWLMFLGSGDLLTMDQIMIAFKEGINQYDFIYGNVNLNNSNELYDGFFDLKKILYKNISHQAIIYNSLIFKKIGFYNTEYKVWADYLFNLELFFNRKVRKKYFELVFCQFLGNGISNSQKDLLFSKRKKRIFISLLFKYLSLSNFEVVLNYFTGLVFVRFKNEK